jgi:hypothetical protein
MTVERLIGLIETALAEVVARATQAIVSVDALKQELASQPRPQVPPQVSVRARTPTVVEGPEGAETEIVFDLVRTTTPTPTCSVNWTLAGAVDAADLADAQPTVGLTTFDPATEMVSVNVRVRGDALVEMDEPLVLTLSNPLGCTIGTQSAQVAIVNDDVPPPPPPPPSRWRSNCEWGSGWRQPRNKYDLINPPNGDGEYQQFERWRGRKIDVVDQFLGSDMFSRNWSALVTNYVLGGTTAEPIGRGTLQATYDAGFIPALAIPFFIIAEARRYDRLAAGDFDAQHRSIAKKVATISQGRLIYLRLAWETNEGYPHSWIEQSLGQEIPDDATWQTYYRTGFTRIARIYRQEVPGCKIVWNHLRNTRRDTDKYEPARDAYDVLGMDVYNALSVPAVVDEEGWQTFAGSYREGRGFNGPLGIAAFARKIGKPVSICEWGVYNKTRLATDPANNGFFIRKMWNFFSDLAADGLMEYECYFHGGGGQQIFPPADSEHNSEVRAAYLDCWRP